MEKKACSVTAAPCAENAADNVFIDKPSVPASTIGLFGEIVRLTSHARVVAIVGVSCCGKTTLARAGSYYKYRWVSSSRCIRARIEFDQQKKSECNTYSGKKNHVYLYDNRELASVSLIENASPDRLWPSGICNSTLYRCIRLCLCGDKIVIDGYPRTAMELQFFSNELQGNALIVVDMPEKDCAYLSGTRLYCHKCGASYSNMTMNPAEAFICDDCGERLMIRKKDRYLQRHISNRSAERDNIMSLLAKARRIKGLQTFLIKQLLSEQKISHKLIVANQIIDS